MRGKSARNSQRKRICPRDLTRQTCRMHTLCAVFRRFTARAAMPIDYAEWVIKLELNAVTDNPLIFFDEDRAKISESHFGRKFSRRTAGAFDGLSGDRADRTRKYLGETNYAADGRRFERACFAAVFNRKRRFEFGFYDCPIHRRRALHRKQSSGASG